MAEQQQPIYVISDSTRTSGRDAQRNNILAAKIVAETVRTTLGPKGMDKMLVDSLGDIIVTNDGVTILEELSVEHPAAKMIVEVAKTQESEVGDGTTTAVVFAGELLKRAESLLDKNVHPTSIVRGYRLAAEEAQKILKKLGRSVSADDTALLKNIALTAMTGKGAEVAKEHLSSLVVDAVRLIGVHSSTLEDVSIEKKSGASIHDTELIKGLLLDKERVHSGMPLSVKNAKIALLDIALEVRSPETDAKIQITDPSQFQSFLDMEERMFKDMVDSVVSSGANVVLCQKGIDDLAQHYLAKKGIYACRRVKKSDMEKLAKATHGTIITNLKELSKEDLGAAGFIEEISVGDDKMTMVKDCVNPKAVTLLVRGGTHHVIEEVERALHDAVGDLCSAIKYGKVVAGAGSCEVELAKQLRTYAHSLQGREQLAVLSFADSLEIIPTTLAENAGLDPIDTLTELKAAHERGEVSAGLDVFTGKVVDAWAQSIIEPLQIKVQAVQSASEVAEMILRIDDVLAAKKPKASSVPDVNDM